MKSVKKVALWIVSIFFSLSSLVYFPSFSSLFAVLTILLIIPIPEWQDCLSKFIKGNLKIIIAIALALLTIFTAPTTEAAADPLTEPQPSVTASEANTNSTTESISAPTAEPTTPPTTEPPHTHSFSAATCTTPKTCSCGATEGKAHGHTWTEATCTSPKTCSVCGATNGSASAHSYSDGKCSVCGSSDPNYSGESETTYVLNIKTMKFHRLSCRKLPTDNREDTTMSREEIIQAGYSPCGICHP